MSSAGSRTDEQDGEGDEEEEDVGHQVEGVHEAAVVEHAPLHAVGILPRVIAAEGQGHAHRLIGPHKPQGRSRTIGGEPCQSSALGSLLVKG